MRKPPVPLEINRPDSSLPLGLPGLDALVPFTPGRLTLVVAPAVARSEVEARLLLAAAAREKESVLVCGDNRLDAYDLLARARARGLTGALADGTWLARAFTVHQFAALLEETLPRLARERRTGAALVTGFLEMFLDEDVRPAEARVLLRRSLSRLGAWASGQGFPVVATLEPPKGARGRELGNLASGLVEHRLEIALTGMGWQAHVAPSGRVVPLDALDARARRQATLRTFAEA